MRSVHISLLPFAVLLLVLSSACGGSPQDTVSVDQLTPELVIELPTAGATQSFVIPTDPPPTSTPVYSSDFENFNVDDFDPSRSNMIDNPWLPMSPGAQYVYEGKTDDNGVMVPHRLVITVTNLTKVIDGVRSLVTWDEDYKAGELVESELAFYAQDRAGNVWRMGEHPEEYQNGQYIEAPTWFAGVNYSVAGIEMLADPQADSRSYSQGWAPSVEFTDRGQVSQLGQSVCVPADCYYDVLIIDETSRAEPGAHQLKLFSRGIGNVKVDWRGADQTQEILELTEINQLDAEELAGARASALQEEQHA
ncbi:MAG TPA: hypothetical protein VIV15_03265, partial [Anaerolineales bacterium]